MPAGECVGVRDLSRWRGNGRPHVDYAEAKPVRLHCIVVETAPSQGARQAAALGADSSKAGKFCCGLASAHRGRPVCPVQPILGAIDRIVTELPFGAFRNHLWEMAKLQFPSDYTGDVRSLDKVGAEERWRWFRETFVTEARERIAEEDALVAWNAIDSAFAASFHERKPKALRDLDATPYTLPFNDTICGFNRRLRELLSDVARRYRM
jgi:hypothetical protein